MRQLDLEAVNPLLAELELTIESIRGKIQNHSAALKSAADQGWPENLSAQAELILSDIQSLRQRREQLEEKIEHELRLAGISSTERAETFQQEAPRWRRTDLTSAVVPGNNAIEENLISGLDDLISRLPQSWWSAQRKSRKEIGTAFLREPIRLCGGALRPRPVDSLNRWAYALMLAADNLDRIDDFDVYEGALLVPFVARLCELMPAIRSTKRGLDKLDELRRLPNSEIDAKIFELVVAASATAMGRSVEFIPAGAGSRTPDLRVHDLGFPAVVECKLQSRASAHEQNDLAFMDTVFAKLRSSAAADSLCGDVRIDLRSGFNDLKPQDVVAAIVDCRSGLSPFGEVSRDWGHVSVGYLPLKTTLSDRTRLYGPDFLEQVFGWTTTVDYDGICAMVKNSFHSLVDEALFPFCIKWRIDSPTALQQRARNVEPLLAKAISQIPAGEAWFLYIGWIDSHRPAVADLRTRAVFDTMRYGFRAPRGTTFQGLTINRIYPEPTHEGRPNLVESAIPLSDTPEDFWHGRMPRTVFVNS